jgi:hypothetical protein
VYAEARYLLDSAIRLATQRGAKLKAITVEGTIDPALAAALTELLNSEGYEGVELRIVPGPSPARLSSVELDGGRR